MGHSVELLFPTQRIVFALEPGGARQVSVADSAAGFKEYKRMQSAGEPAAMLAIPNSCVIRAGRDYAVDPGIFMQGAPYTRGLELHGINPITVQDVILTHMHFDHVQALVEFPGRRVFVHRTELESPYGSIWSGLLELVDIEILEGEEGEIEPGVRWILTPGHCDGLITLLVDTDEGLVAIPSDCVGPLPEFYDKLDLPEDFGPERELLLEQWRRIAALKPVKIIPGHYAPFRPSYD